MTKSQNRRNLSYNWSRKNQQTLPSKILKVKMTMVGVLSIKQKPISSKMNKRKKYQLLKMMDLELIGLNPDVRFLEEIQLSEEIFLVISFD